MTDETERPALDDTEISAVYRANRTSWLRFGYRLTGSTAEAEDLLAEALTRTLETLKRRGEGVENLAGYVSRAMRNIHVNAWRREAGRTIDDDADIDSFAVDVPGVDVTAAMAVRDALATLPEDWRDALWYTEVEGRKPRELARTFNMTPNAVSVMCFRARQGLKVAYLAGELAPAADAACGAYDEDIAASAVGTLGARGTRRLDEHLVTCADCRARVSQAEKSLLAMHSALAPVLAALGSSGNTSFVAPAGIALKVLIGAAAGIAAVGGGVGLWLALSSPEPSVAAAPVRTDVTSLPAPVVTLTETPTTAATPVPAPSPTPVETPTPSPTPTLDPPPPAPTPTPTRSPTPMPPPVVEIAGMAVSIDTSRLPTEGVLAISTHSLGAGDVLVSTISLPAGAAWGSADGWSCEGQGQVVCQTQGPSSGEFALTFDPVAKAVDGLLELEATITHDPSHQTQGMVSSPFTLPGPTTD